MRRKLRYANEKSGLTAVWNGARDTTWLMAMLTALLAFGPKDAVSMDLTPYEWKNRLLFIFAPDRHHQNLNQIQAEIGARKAGVEDRELVVFEVYEKDASKLNGMVLSRPDADALRERFEITRSSFTVVLVGKDGGVKLKRNGRASLNEIFGLIDSMPMRRYEMRQHNQ